MVNKFPFEDGEGELKLRCRLNGPEIDQEVIIGRQGYRVGRSSENNITLNHREISRQHTRITWSDDNRYYVEDLNSSNGTFLNEEKLEGRSPIPLQEGDYVRFGPFLLTIIEVFEEKRERPRLGLMAQQPMELMTNGHVTYPPGIPRDRSTWLKYLPSIYEDDEFLGRYLLIFESIMSPITWVIDNFEEYLSPEMAPAEWVQWLASWFDVLLLPEVPEPRQREVLKQIGWLFLRRGTRAGLERLLELYFGVNVTITEPRDQPAHFIVNLPLSKSEVKLDRETVEYLIRSQTPAFASFDLQIS